MKTIADAGSGIIVMVNRPTPNFMSTIMKARSSNNPDQAKHASDRLRDYGIGAQILSELGVHDMLLLTDSHTDLVALGGHSLRIVEHRSLSGRDAGRVPAVN